MLSKILNFVKLYQRDIFLACCFVMVAFISFNLGKINSLQKTPVKVGEEANIYQALSNNQETSQNSAVGQANGQPAPIRTDLRVVASKKSTSKKYHFSWCPGAKQINEENKLWFNTEQDALTAGYTLAGNCTK